MRKPYKTDLTDAQSTIIEPLIPPAKPPPLSWISVQSGIDLMNLVGLVGSHVR